MAQFLRFAASLVLCSPLLAAVAAANLDDRGVPAEPTGVKNITSPQGASIRYKQPGKEGICETMKGVNDYAGYISLNEETNMFFWFFEAREDPTKKPLTLWLNGGPGSDSLIGLFEENGPCNVTENLTTQWNPYSWTEESNMLYLSQPIGVGFSYQIDPVGSMNQSGFVNASEAPPDGRFALVDPNFTNTTDAAAIGTWHILQAFLDLSPRLDPNITNFTFNLWTESYGGHYGPSFYKYFYQQNLAIANGTLQGVPLRMDSLGIINGLVDQSIQAPYYPEFAVNNTYGIKAVNDTIYSFMKLSYFVPGTCRDNLEACRSANLSTGDGQTTCVIAQLVCRSVESPYSIYSGRDVYDIREPTEFTRYWPQFLNLSSTQQALGVDINYTAMSSDIVYEGFFDTGDLVYPNFIEDLEEVLDYGVRVALIYGDADYICNWFGGEAVSLALNYSHSTEFAAAGYAPFVVNGTEYGAVRQYGNFSFTRIYEAGHEVPYYQPKASLELFRRILGDLVVSDGNEFVKTNYATNGSANATHTESFVPLPSTETSVAASTDDSANPTVPPLR